MKEPIPPEDYGPSIFDTRPPGSPRWCSYCDEWGSHHTERCRGGEEVRAQVLEATVRLTQRGFVTPDELARHTLLPVGAVAAALIELGRRGELHQVPVPPGRKLKRHRILVASGRRLPMTLWTEDSPDLHVRITVRGYAEQVRRQIAASSQLPERFLLHSRRPRSGTMTVKVDPAWEQALYEWFTEELVLLRWRRLYGLGWASWGMGV